MRYEFSCNDGPSDAHYIIFRIYKKRLILYFLFQKIQV